MTQLMLLSEHVEALMVSRNAHVAWGSVDDDIENEDAPAIDRRLREHARRRARDDYELGRLLRRGYVVRVHVLAGFASFREYVDHVFGYTGRQTEERLRVAEALERLPGLSVKLARGELCFSVVRELTRVCTEQSELEWIAVAEGRTAREVERMVSGRSLGDSPDTPPKPEAQMYRISRKVNASTWALWQEALRVLVAETGGSLDDDGVIATMARRVLGAPADEGRSNYQIAMNVCEECGRVTQRAGGGHVTIEDAAFEAACCDAQHVGKVDAPAPERATQEVPPRVRRAVLARHEHRCAVPGCRHAVFIDVHHMDLRSEGGGHDPGRLIALCAAHHGMVHDGRLIIRGTFSAGFTFEHADGRAYGSPRFDAASSDAWAQAFSALCEMGFKQREARAMIDSARPHVRADLGMPDLLREVLRLTPTSSRVSAVREASAEYVRLVA